MSAPRFTPARAPVRPRVGVVGGSVPRLLEEEVADLLAAGTRTMICLVAPSGAGLTTALAHLAASFAGDARLGLRDVDGSGNDGELVTVVARGSPAGARGPVLELLPWSDDDCLEYLVHAHRERAAAAYAAWRRPGPAHDLRQWPGLCRGVLDVLAERTAEQDGLDPFTALDVVLDRQLTGEVRVHARAVALRHSTAVSTYTKGSPDPTLPLLHSQTVRTRLAAEQIVQLVDKARAVPLATLHWSPGLLDAVGRQVVGTPGREQHLAELLQQTDTEHFASALSVLCAARPGFRPSVAQLGLLQHAYLAGADLRGCRFRAALDHADLTGADLRGADLKDASAKMATLDCARLDGALLEQLHGDGCSIVFASAPNANLRMAGLRDASLRMTILDGACLREAVLAHCCLDEASLRGADLTQAHLLLAQLDGTDLSGAICTAAALTGLDLRTARLDHVVFDRARLERANLSGTVATALSAERAVFLDALLTGARWPKARLCDANFTRAGLAGVDWEGADLRRCNFTNAAFHLGSSRSGLVGSEIAGEGSRTGFYTDESLEDRFRAPEDVRKANLRHCDLRGAWLGGCDFYLVDLRGAVLDRDQLEWLRRCRAILDRPA